MPGSNRQGSRGRGWCDLLLALLLCPSQFFGLRPGKVFRLLQLLAARKPLGLGLNLIDEVLLSILVQAIRKLEDPSEPKAVEVELADRCLALLMSTQECRESRSLRIAAHSGRSAAPGAVGSAPDPEVFWA